MDGGQLSLDFHQKRNTKEHTYGDVHSRHKSGSNQSYQFRPHQSLLQSHGTPFTPPVLPSHHSISYPVKLLKTNTPQTRHEMPAKKGRIFTLPLLLLLPWGIEKEHQKTSTQKRKQEEKRRKQEVRGKAASQTPIDPNHPNLTAHITPTQKVIEPEPLSYNASFICIYVSMFVGWFGFVSS